jgi:hypothetical protein
MVPDAVPEDEVVNQLAPGTTVAAQAHPEVVVIVKIFK